MKRKYLGLMWALLLVSGGAMAQQKLSDGTEGSSVSTNANAILELASKNKGLLHTRVALVQTDNASPLSEHIAGMMVYNTATNNDVVPGIYYNDGSTWVLASAGNATNISYNPSTYEITFTDKDGNLVMIDFRQVVKANETVTTLEKLAEGQYRYTSEDGTETTINVTQDVINNFDQIVNESNTEVIEQLIEILGDTYVGGNVYYDGNTFTYVDENGDSHTVNFEEIIAANETLTTLGYNATTNELTYTGENGTPVVLNLNEGSIAYNATTNVLTYTDEAGVDTPISLNNTGLTYNAATSILSYVNTLGVTQTVDLGALVKANETLTTLAYNATTNELTYTGEDGLAVLLNLNEGAASYNATTNVLTYTDQAGVATALNLNNTSLSYNETTKILSYVNTLGQTQAVDLGALVKANETLTTLAYNATTNQLTYTGEDGLAVLLNLNEGAASYNATTNVLTYTDQAGVATALNLNNTSLSYNETTKILSYVNTLGQTQTVDLGAIVKANETNTTLSLTAGELVYNNEKANNANVDLISTDLNNALVAGTDGALFTPTITADNGLTKVNDVIELGGTLTKATEIVTDATKTLAIAGLQQGVISGATPDNLVVADATTGVLKTIPISSTAVEPWQIQGTTDKANTNTDNIYQMGSVAVGKNETISNVKLDVNGAVLLGNQPTTDQYFPNFVGENAVIMGHNNRASGKNAVAFGGQGNKASNINAVVWGGDGKDYSNSQGFYWNEANGVGSTAFGAGTRANYDFSTVWGGSNIGNHQFTTVWGTFNTANAAVSTAWGSRNIASGDYETVFGTYNAITENSNAILQIGIGRSDDRKNALTILKNGNIGTDIAIAPTERLDIGSGNVRVRDINTVAGADTDKIVVADATGVLKTIPISSTAVEPWQIQSTTDKANTNTDNIYQMGSVAVGKNETISNVKLDVNGAVLLGNQDTTNPYFPNFVGENAVIMGHKNRASGKNAVAFGGQGNVASGLNSVVWGGHDDGSDASSSYRNEANGIGSTAFGIDTRANSYLSTVWGFRNISDNYFTTVWGVDNTAKAAVSTVWGSRNIASGDYETVFGLFNAITENSNAILQIGIGRSDDRKNALTILKNGNIGTDIAIAPTERLDIGSGNVRVRDINTVAGADTDKIVVADASGVLKTVTAATPKFFYSPSIVLPTNPASLSDGVTYDAGTETFTVNLHGIYNNQFGMVGDVAGAGRTAIKSSTATTLPVLTASELEYFVTYFDNTVFDPTTITLDDAGIMTYKIVPSAAVTEKTYMNIVFKVK